MTKIYICLNVNKRYFSTSLKKIEFSKQIFETYLNIKLDDITSSIRDVPFGQT
jgi:hypothetical protein